MLLVLKVNGNIILDKILSILSDIEHTNIKILNEYNVSRFQTKY